MIQNRTFEESLPIIEEVVEKFLEMASLVDGDDVIIRQALSSIVEIANEMAKALEFYAAAGSYKDGFDHTCASSDVMFDEGKRAQQALTKFHGGEENGKA